MVNANKIKSLYAVLIIVCLIFTACGKSEENNNISQSSAKEKIIYNGDEITEEEIEYFKARNRSEVIKRYYDKYESEKDFWSTPIEGKAPAEILYELSLKEAKEYKAAFQVMREKGIYEDISFEALKLKAQEYNKTHANTPGNVGLNTIDMKSFYTYYYQTGKAKLSGILNEDADEYIEKYTAATE